MIYQGKEIGMVFLKGCRCRCGHEWLPRNKEEKPRVCPKCKSATWDRPFLNKNRDAKKGPYKKKERK
jgi:predicted Zn-ribbon and HTH transcriptional regulator